MVTKNDQSKSKQRGSRQYPIDFVVPLQLEECIHRIQRHFAHTTDIDIRVLPQIGNDTAAFVLRLKGKRVNQFVMTISGTMYRWEGVSTRFEGKLDSWLSTEVGELLWIMLLPPLVTIIGLGMFAIFNICIIILLELSMPSARWIGVGFFGTICLELIAALGMTFIFLMLYHELLKNNAKRRLIKTFVERLTRIPS